MELNYSDEYMVDKENYKTSPYFNKKQANKLKIRSLDDCEQIIVHCTAAGTPLWENPLTCIKYDMGPNHISRSGCPTATYHFYINQKGETWQLVSMELVTWNCSGQNNNSVAICINHNGFNQDEITPELYQSLVDTCCHVFDKLDWGYDSYGVADRIHFHRDYAPKACPGKLDKNQLIKDVAKRLEIWGDSL